MKKLVLVLCMFLGLILTGCASYEATSLSAVDPSCVQTYPDVEGVSIGCKAYSQKDCYDYLDRDVLAKGYQPVLLTFQNAGRKQYVFSASNMSVPYVPYSEVAERVHTSTAGRIVGYSAGSLVCMASDYSCDCGWY